MKKLTLNDFLLIREEKNDVYNYEIDFLSYSTQQPATSTSYPTMSLKVSKKNVVLNKNFKNDDIILKEAIDLLLKNKEPETEIDIYNENNQIFYFEKSTKPEVNELNYRKFVSRILIASNKIAIQSRIGPGQIIIFPKDFKEIKIEYGLKSFYCEHLSNKIIILRKNSISQPSLFLIKNNNKYVVDMIDDYKYSYEIISTKSKKRFRIDKIKKIFSN